MSETEYSPEMRLFSLDGQRLYLTAQERDQFLDAAEHEDRENQMFCRVLHYTGCRPSEALELVPGRVLMDEKSLVFRSLKKRKEDSRGRTKLPQYRSVPVPNSLVKELDFVFGIRKIQKRGKGLDDLLWTMSRPTAYRLVKRVMNRAGIEGKQATGKGLRHGFGVAMVTAKKPLPLHILSQLMGHSDTKTTEIYLQVVGEEKRKLVEDAWEG
ncbi:MAG: site-specific integrase [Candidatus Thiodiazotropha endolucinida]|uniref:Site-specific integrase n=1 Tax=Candidatus Thiodiazotropha taylori TaxID=2792791 RepID=A0A9E4NHP5_9GAMM|nr:site-specific integrase [Candidatus Thiodiazotropha taylori]MCW4235562.1 site-specific integrase [Candidatus Thiodiazotropha endolucinida]